MPHRLSTTNTMQFPLAETTPLALEIEEAYFDRQELLHPKLDIFAVIGLPANDLDLTRYGIAYHIKTHVIRHIPEYRGSGVRTIESQVPL